jgi:hypothetical protein
MQLRFCAHLTGRNVKVVQPGLVYVIKVALDAVVSFTSSVPQGTDDVDVNADED